MKGFAFNYRRPLSHTFRIPIPGPLFEAICSAVFLPYMNAYPLPNGPEVLDLNGNHQGIAQFNASYSDPGTLNAYSLRVDHKIDDKIISSGVTTTPLQS